MIYIASDKQHSIKRSIWRKAQACQ